MAVVTDQIRTDEPEHGGVYILFITHDERANGQDILNEVIIDATQWTGAPIQYEVWMNGTTFISSRLDPAGHPPVQPGATRTWTGLNTRIDNKQVSYSVGP